jgi:quinol monooxygenase YgiN
MSEKTDRVAEKMVEKVQRFWGQNSSWVMMCVGCAAVGFLVARVASSPALRVTAEKEAFVLMVNIEFQDVAQKEEFMTLFQPMAQYVADYEPTTLSYECAESDKNEKQVVIIERYLNKQAYAGTHRESQVFLAYKQKLKEMDAAGKMHISGHSVCTT